MIEKRVYYELREGRITHLKEFTLSLVAQLTEELGLCRRVLRQIGAGKEASVFLVELFSGKLAALKVYRFYRTSHDFVARSAQSLKYKTASILAQQEWENLNKAYSVGVNVPQPLEIHDCFLLMEYLGTSQSTAPLLAYLGSSDLPNPVDTLSTLLDFVDQLFHEAKLVHGDLSEHNILFYHAEPYLIDFLQSFQWTTDKEGEFTPTFTLSFLQRDLKNLLQFFKKRYRVSFDEQTVLSEVLREFSPIGG